MSEEKVGVFLGKWTIGEPKPGAKLVHLQVIVDVVNKRITGTATLTQAVNPPLDHPFQVSGLYHDITIPGGVAHAFSLRTPVTPLFGAPSIEIIGDFANDWQKGVATVHYAIGSTFGSLVDAPIAVAK